jgi:thioredoxin 1
MANLLNVTDANFNAEVLQSDKPVLVDFGATWCGPCKQLAPIVEQLASEYAGETAMQYGIMSVPTLIFFRGGKVQEQLVGFTTKASLQEKINRVLA